MRRIIIAGFLFLLIAAGRSTPWASIDGNGQEAVVRTLTAKTMDAATMNIGFGANYDQSGDYVKGPGGTGDVINTSTNGTVTPEPAQLFSANPYLAFGLTSFWDIAASIPGYYDWSGFGPTDGGIGDLDISTKLLYLGMRQKRLFYQAYFLDVTVPVGMRNNGLFPRHPYYIEGLDTNPAKNFYSSDYATFKALLLWTLDVGNVNPTIPLQINFNLGAVFTGARNNMRNTMIEAIALQYKPLDFLTFFVDFYGESRWSNFSEGYKLNNDPVYLTPGVRVTAPSGIYVMLGGDFSLSSNSPADRMNWDKKGYRYSTGVIPAYGVQFAFGWHGNLVRPVKKPDTIIVTVTPPLPKGFAVVDTVTDSDSDGVPDFRDRCPRIAEDKDGFEDDDGCPDLDNDQDGIADSLDKCPNLPEDFDHFEDADGCPDLDNDQDGFPDIKDKCPNEPEIYNGYQDDDGCPDSLPRKDPGIPAKQVLRGVAFSASTADLSVASYPVLDALIKKLKEFPEVTIEVGAYTDGLGDKVINAQLTQLRAEAVRQYLVSKGIEPGRIRAAGYGPASPVADNRTAAGRTANRRIEILRIK
ncbi:MAG: OmpA family protein [Chitinivibrionales bacterium]|nr:OmpA family protein [Chitinivibrionales bacterium]